MLPQVVQQAAPVKLPSPANYSEVCEFTAQEPGLRDLCFGLWFVFNSTFDIRSTNGRDGTLFEKMLMTHLSAPAADVRIQSGTKLLAEACLCHLLSTLFFRQAGFRWVLGFKALARDPTPLHSNSCSWEAA